MRNEHEGRVKLSVEVVSNSELCEHFGNTGDCMSWICLVC